MLPLGILPESLLAAGCLGAHLPKRWQDLYSRKLHPLSHQSE